MSRQLRADGLEEVERLEDRVAAQADRVAEEERPVAEAGRNAASQMSAHSGTGCRASESKRRLATTASGSARMIVAERADDPVRRADLDVEVAARGDEPAEAMRRDVARGRGPGGSRSSASTSAPGSSRRTSSTSSGVST